MIKVVKSRENRFFTVMTAIFVVLLLISQLSLSSTYTNAIYALDVSNDSFEIEELEINDSDDYNDFYVHDFILQEQARSLSSKPFSLHLTLIYIVDYLHSGSIRSPPLFTNKLLS